MMIDRQQYFATCINGVLAFARNAGPVARFGQKAHLIRSCERLGWWLYVQKCAGDAAAREKKLGKPQEVVFGHAGGRNEGRWSVWPKCMENPLWRPLMGKQREVGMLCEESEDRLTSDSLAVYTAVYFFPEVCSFDMTEPMIESTTGTNYTCYSYINILNTSYRGLP